MVLSIVSGECGVCSAWQRILADDVKLKQGYCSRYDVMKLSSERCMTCDRVRREDGE
jgi:hypothetical protein